MFFHFIKTTGKQELCDLLLRSMKVETWKFSNRVLNKAVPWLWRFGKDPEEGRGSFRIRNTSDQCLPGGDDSNYIKFI